MKEIKNTIKKIKGMFHCMHTVLKFNIKWIVALAHLISLRLPPHNLALSMLLFEPCFYKDLRAIG